MTGHPQAMSAERIEKAAEAIFAEFHPGEKWDRSYGAEVNARYLFAAEAALRAAYPELADGSSVILPREASKEMRYAWEGEGGVEDWARMRDAALSAPEST